MPPTNPTAEHQQQRNALSRYNIRDVTRSHSKSDTDGAEREAFAFEVGAMKAYIVKGPTSFRDVTPKYEVFCGDLKLIGEEAQKVFEQIRGDYFSSREKMQLSIGADGRSLTNLPDNWRIAVIGQTSEGISIAAVERIDDEPGRFKGKAEIYLGNPGEPMKFVDSTHNAPLERSDSHTYKNENGILDLGYFEPPTWEGSQLSVFEYRPDGVYFDCKKV